MNTLGTESPQHGIPAAGDDIGHPASRHGRRVYLVLAGLAILGIGLWIAVGSWKDRLSVASIVVRGNTVVTRDQVVALAQVPPRAGLHIINLVDIERRISANPFVKAVTAKRDAPSTLVIAIEERSPIALLSMSARNELFFLDDEGIVLPYLTTEAVFDVPLISGDAEQADVAVGRPLATPTIRSALDLLRTAQIVSVDLYHLISEVRVATNGDMVLYSADTGVPVVFGNGEAARKIVTLDTFWKRFIAQQGSDNINSIDLRFADQVIVRTAEWKDL